jgi:RimJ/RimL family protein N-acetyltransferase
MPATWSTRIGRPRVGEVTLVVLTSLLLTVFALAWAFRVKEVCGGAPFDEWGRSSIFPAGPPRALIPCYSDIMRLWIGRDVDRHVFPYIHGGINEQGDLFGGVVEYPVLSGMLLWLGAIGAHTDVQFLQHSALILAPFALATTALLAVMTRWWVLLWAATPPLVLYAFHNWELPVVFTSVAAVAVMAYGGSVDPRTGGRRMSLRRTAIIAAVFLGIGFSLKLYPGFFVLPLALYVLTGGQSLRARRTLDWVGAAWVAGTATVVVIATQAPFMIAGYDGWKAALDFQGRREADLTTNSVWYWGLRLLTGGETDTYHSLVGVLSPLLVAAGFAVAVWLGWRVYQRDGVFPWLGVAAAMLCAFMVFHKVHSPQYTLWILPFFVMLRVRWWIIAAYLLTDVLLDISIFRLMGYMHHPASAPWQDSVGVSVSVWVHAAILVALIVGFVRMPLREPLASYLTTSVAPRGPLTRLADADDADARAWVGTPTLVRGDVTLRPLRTSDAGALATLVPASDLSLYAWTGPIPQTPEDATRWITTALSTPTRVPFAVLHDGEFVGTTSLYDVDASNRTLAVGFTFYGRAAMGTVVNPTSKLLLLEHAFDRCGAVRVVWHTHEGNSRSRAAIAKLGAEFEGLLRKHRRFGDGWRTTAQFAMTDDDWPGHRDRLLERAAR